MGDIIAALFAKQTNNMMLLPQTMIQIVGSGGGLIIDLDKQMLLTDSMIQIAAAAAHSGAKVTFRLGKTILLSDVMIQIAAAGRGSVTFDLR
ncbi:MAG: hypothetical protein WC805_00410 [Patescibacteria group bacterium]